MYHDGANEKGAEMDVILCAANPEWVIDVLGFFIGIATVYGLFVQPYR
jgi:hypothetical protein